MPRGRLRSDRPVGGRGPPEAHLVLAGRSWVRGRLQPVEIGISEEGRIVRLGRSLRGVHRHDVGDAVILPSSTDLHVHLREPGGPRSTESFETGTLEAALGGVGVVADMPNTRPPIDSVERLEEKIARARGRLQVDAVFYAAATDPASIATVSGRAGAFKLYLAPTSGLDDPPSDGSRLKGLLDAVARRGLALSVHAEDPGRFRSPADPPPKSLLEWDAARPLEAERGAVERLLEVAPPELRLHVAHVSLASVAGRLALAGQSFEASPHHLLLSNQSELGSLGKVNPPLRSEAERLALWAEFAAGRIPIVATDHAPHAIEEKERPFELAPSGMPGLETGVPLLLEEVRRGSLGLSVLLQAAMDRPARWLGLPVGRIAVGHRANLLVVDFTAKRTVRAKALHAPCGWSAFEGRPAIFPKEHYRDGVRFVEGGEFVGRPDGRVLRPEYAPGPP
ncbi:MAG TPA: amidohydrolase family protein [Thermoplasmata archaeon]|nr:amidohydrolase family protein [Thermoplasmata archaeon]